MVAQFVRHVAAIRWLFVVLAAVVATMMQKAGASSPSPPRAEDATPHAVNTSVKDTLAATCTSAQQTPRVYDVAVVGAGLAGLVVAQQLRRTGTENIVVLEASHRVGGRLRNSHDSSGKDELIDMGGAWVWRPHQPLMQGLVVEVRATRLFGCCLLMLIAPTAVM